MARVSLNKAQSGMVLATDALSASGDILLGTGTVLTEKHLQRLEKAGCTSLHIQDDDDEQASAVQEDVGNVIAEPSASLPEAVIKKLEQIDAKFAGLQDNPQMQMIHNLVREAITAGANGD